MIKLSLALNIAVLVPIGTGLALDTGWVGRAYGESTQARGILLSIYLAIAVLSLVLLIRPDRRMTTALLLVQVIYKVTTPFTVGTLQNPVVISNLAIAAVHTATLVLILRTQKSTPPPELRAT
ncbi:MAG TPA: hypothetical protein VK860_02040 [Ilumatobacteraceae bacterium]|nr:hypothetical protein [Ilumatobacteraceae bacterium]